MAVIQFIEGLLALIPDLGKVLIAFLALLGLAGCGVLESREAAVRESSEAIMMKVIDKAQIDASNLSARGVLINPSYEYTWCGGPVIYSAGMVRMVGGEVRGEVVASGVGTGPADQDMRLRIDSILGRHDVDEADKQRMVYQAIVDWIKARTAPATQPAGAK